MKKKIYTSILMSMFALCGMAQNPASTVLSTNFDGAFTDFGSNPTGWVSANIIATGTVTASTPGYGGSVSAAKIETKTLAINPNPNIIPTTSGILLAGKLQQVGFSYTILQGQPYTNKPEGMAYYTKYTPVGVDSGFAYVLLSKWNTVTNKRDTIAIGGDTIKSAIATWTKRNVHLFYTTTTVTPDTLQILFSSSSRTAAQLGTLMYVDEINLYEAGTSGVKETIEKDFELYPNPANNYFIVKNYKSKYSSMMLRDLTGQVKLQSQLAKNESTKIDLNELASGVYFVSILNDRGEIIQTKKLNVVK